MRQSCTVIEIFLKKTGQGDNLSPSKFTEKIGKEVHMNRFSYIQKLQAKTEHGKCILSHPVIAHCPFKVHSQVMFFSPALLNKHVSCSTRRGELTWQLTLMSHQKDVRTIESFFALNRSQTESEKTIQKMNSVLIRKKWMRIKGNRKHYAHSRKPAARSHMIGL